MTVDMQTRKQELLDQLAGGATDRKIYEELMALNLAEEKLQAERQAQVDKVIQTIRDLGIELSELRSAFSPSQLRGAKATKKRVSRRSGELLIANLKTAGGKGAPSNYHRGQMIPQYVPKAFKELFLASKEGFEDALKPYFTKAGKTYFATKDGRAELEAWIEFVRKGKVSPK